MEKKKRVTPVEMPQEIQDLNRRVEQWRRRRRSREPMPGPLWDLAAGVAREHGVARVARIVRLGYQALKKRLNSFDSRSEEQLEKGPAFIEMRIPFTASLPECIVELEHPGGSRMRIHVKGGPAPDLPGLIRGFWRTDS